MTARTAIGKSRANAGCDVNVSCAVAIAWALALLPREFTLKNLASATDGTKWVAIDNKERRIRRHNVAAPCAYLLGIRFVDSRLGCVCRLIVIDQLRACERR